MFEQLVPVKHVEEILELHGKDVRIKDCFCDALQGVLKECEKTGYVTLLLQFDETYAQNIIGKISDLYEWIYF